MMFSNPCMLTTFSWWGVRRWQHLAKDLEEEQWSLAVLNRSRTGCSFLDSEFGMWHLYVKTKYASCSNDSNGLNWALRDTMFWGRKFMVVTSFLRTHVSLIGLVRLVRGPSTQKDAQKYVQSARQRITLNAAATAWAQGVPWSEALNIAERAIAQATPKSRAIPKGKAKAKGKAAPKRAQWGRWLHLSVCSIHPNNRFQSQLFQSNWSHITVIFSKTQRFPKISPFSKITALERQSIMKGSKKTVFPVIYPVQRISSFNVLRKML